jgi:purine-binding chemotaxis protein CheW
MTEPRRICTFKIGDRLFGLDVTCVSEVIRSAPPSSVPLAPESLHGLINLRGQIIPLINLHLRLGFSSPSALLPLPGHPDSTPSMSMVIRTAEGPLCFPIDDVGDVLNVTPDRLEPVPDGLSGVARAMIECVCQLPSHLLLILKNEIPILPPL